MILSYLINDYNNIMMYHFRLSIVNMYDIVRSYILKNNHRWSLCYDHRIIKMIKLCHYHILYMEKYIDHKRQMILKFHYCKDRNQKYHLKWSIF